jgi:hypothetical protein
VQGWVSRTTRLNERWAVDTTHLFCGRDGWCHLTAIIDFHERAVSIKPPFVSLPNRTNPPDFHPHSQRIRLEGSVHAGIRQRRRCRLLLDLQGTGLSLLANRY